MFSTARSCSCDPLTKLPYQTWTIFTSNDKFIVSLRATWNTLFTLKMFVYPSSQSWVVFFFSLLSQLAAMSFNCSAAYKPISLLKLKIKCEVKDMQMECAIILFASKMTPPFFWNGILSDISNQKQNKPIKLHYDRNSAAVGVRHLRIYFTAIIIKLKPQKWICSQPDRIILFQIAFPKEKISA